MTWPFLFLLIQVLAPTRLISNQYTLKTDKFIPHDNQKYLIDNNILSIYLLLG